MAEKKGSVLGVVVSLGLAAAVLYGCKAMLTPRERTAAEKSADKFEMALIRCQNATKDSVADPDGMRFAPFGEWLAARDEVGDGWTFTYGVVAKNAFGALVPATVQCHATYDGQYWTATDLKQM